MSNQNEALKKAGECSCALCGPVAAVEPRPQSRRTTRKALTDRQIEIVSEFAKYRWNIDSYTDGCTIETSVLFAVADALELLGYDREVVDTVAKLIGADDFLGPSE